MGFIDIKPFSNKQITNIEGKPLTESDVERRQLADKLISGNKLTRSEIRTIYKYLTGYDAPNQGKRGRKSVLLDRDMDIAFEYLEARVNGSKKASDIKKELGIKYGLAGLKDVRDDTFYKAFNNGLKFIEQNARDWISDVEYGAIENMTPKHLEKQTAIAREHLELIEKYRKLKR